MDHTLLHTTQSLREQLLAPQAIERVHALHALEREADHADAADAAFARELQAFTARGIPYYAPEDAAYLKWVDKAVAYWARLHPN